MSKKEINEAEVCLKLLFKGFQTCDLDKIKSSLENKKFSKFKENFSGIISNGLLKLWENSDIDDREKDKIFEYLFVDNKKFVGIGSGIVKRECFFLSCKKGAYSIVKMILRDKKFNPSVGNNKAIIYAAESGKELIVGELLNDKRVDPTVKGYKPLKLAVKKGYYEIVKALLVDERVNVLKLHSKYPKWMKYADKNIREGVKRVFNTLLTFAENGILVEGNIITHNGIGKLWKVNWRRKIILYEGRFNEFGEKNGAGKLYDTNNGNMIYYGEFINNKREGLGIAYNKFGRSIKRGIWKKDKLIKSHYPPISKARKEDLKTFNKNCILGKGNNGTVYYFNNKFAFKHLDKISFDRDNSNDLEIIENNLRMLTFLNHKNIIAIGGYNVAYEPKGYFVEFCQGGSVFEKIIHADTTCDGLNACLPMDVKLKYLVGVAKGMKYLHQECVMHRDLRWNNVLIHKDGTVKIKNFGVAKINETFRFNNNHSIDVGTPVYLAPEVLTGEYSYSVDGNYIYLL